MIAWVLILYLSTGPVVVSPISNETECKRLGNEIKASFGIKHRGVRCFSFNSAIH